MIKQEESRYSYDIAKMKFYSSFSRLADMTDGADGYYFHMRVMNDFLLYGTTSITSEIKEYLMKENLHKTHQYGWHIHTIGKSQYLIASYKYGNVDFGAWINLETIKDEILSDIVYEGGLVSFEQTADVSEDNDKIWITSSVRNISLNIVHDREEVFQQISTRSRFLHIMSILYMIAIPLLYVFLRYFLFKPLKKINYAHRELQKGNLDYRIKERGSSSDYEEAFKSFNLMAEKLQEYRIEVYENEIARQKMELRNLHLQIRPHFLLNTFNLIHTLVQKNKNKYVETVIIYLSKYFRFIFRSNNDMEPFVKELEIIRDYIKIASIRYNNMVKLKIKVDPFVKRVLIPPLLIHNFVENSVKHGIIQGKILNISIRGIYNDGVVTFCITDDGNGMDRETLDRTRSVLNGEIELENQHFHIGVYNSFKRLRWYYGEKAKIEVESEQEVMTRFTIQFPYDLEVDNESVNC